MVLTDPKYDEARLILHYSQTNRRRWALIFLIVRSDQKKSFAFFAAGRFNLLILQLP
jgi:hypothetical protein